ncbi:MAG: response regulator transcription factor [Anaerolineaceae bacterium]|nr:response regulator transcription factor [Anaerolineaceae bacterium]
MKERILIIEDDKAIIRVLERSLIYEGYEVDYATNGERGLELAQNKQPSLVILDLMLPSMDGIEVCEKLREENSSIPILMLTARGALDDRVRGLDAGADDYMVKPFELEELLARIRSLLRRSKAEHAVVLKFADLKLDTTTRQAERGERAIPLTTKEYELLELFMRHPRQILSRETIFDRVWGYDFGGESNVLDVYIRYLRQKLESGDEARLIHTIRGTGYVLRETP